MLRRPQSNPLRRVLFQIHLWTGLTVALYVVLIGVTGAALVFRPEFQEAAFPQYFAAVRGGERDASPAVIIQTLRDRYPEHQLLGIDFPTSRRNTYLSYVSKGSELRAVFSHPDSGQILGEMPKESWITILQDLHFDLLSGSTGRTVNGFGALSLMLMFATGLVVWWPGIGRWRQSLRVDFRGGWKRVNWDLHSAAGFWLFALLMLWAVTGVEFAFREPFRRLVNTISPLTVVRTPESSVPGSAAIPPDASVWVDNARAAVAGAKPGRVVWPSTDRAPALVVMARVDHGDFDISDEVLVYFDRYTGELLQRREPASEASTTGDLIMQWLGPLHVGSFGGMGIKILWFALGLSFPLMAVTGVLMWWNRLGRSWFRGGR